MLGELHCFFFFFCVILRLFWVATGSIVQLNIQGCEAQAHAAVWLSKACLIDSASNDHAAEILSLDPDLVLFILNFNNSWNCGSVVLLCMVKVTLLVQFSAAFVFS